jgi:TonB-linked SusC/RagA family outer membrane protein
MRSKFKWILTFFIALNMQFSFAQEKTITGKVSDANGPIPGVNIVIKGTNKGSSTGFDGNYSIKANTGDVLVYSFLGLKDVTRTVGEVKVLNVTLQEDAKQIETVVITSFNIKKRKDALISATQAVGNKELSQAAAPGVLQSLAGKVSGLQINNSATGVNSQPRVVLRGPRSITGNNEALVVIDGAISTLVVLNQLPTDIVENVTVLKGQQGGALYGKDGANGVIIVSTKKGNKGKLTATFNSAVDVQSIAFVPEVQTRYGQGWYGYDFNFLNASDPRNTSPHFQPFENGSWGEPFDTGAFANTVVPVGLPQADGKFFTDIYKSRGKDNLKSFYQNGVIFQNGLTLNSGTDQGYMLFNYTRQTGEFVVEGDELKKNNFLLKAGKKMGKLNIEGSINYTNTTTTQTDAALLGELIQTPTNVDIPRYRNSGNTGHWTVYAKNPYQLIKDVRNDDSNDLFIANLELGYELNKNISLKYTGNLRGNYNVNESHDNGAKIDNYTYNFSEYDDQDHGLAPTYSDLGGANIQSSYFIGQSFRRNVYSDIVASFNYKLSENLTFKANLGALIQDSKFRFANQGGNELKTPGYYNIANVLQPSNNYTLGNRLIKERSFGYFTNLDLEYKDYLFLNGAARYDQSSPVANAYPFSSIGLSFIPFKAFDLKSDTFNYLKLTGSYTTLGNTSPVSPYDTNVISRPASGLGFPFGGIVGYELNNTLTEPTIKPEILKTIEFGLNAGFFKDRITLETSVYKTRTEDMIVNAVTPTSSGALSARRNTGVMESTGFEVDLGLTPIKSENFEWNLRAGITKYKSIVKELSDGITQVSLQQQAGNGIGIFAEVGEEFPLIKGTKFLRDPNGNIIVNSFGNPTKTSSFEKLGKANPDYILNFSNTITYKGLSLTAVADFRTGHSIYSETYRNLQFTGGAIESAEQDRFQGYVIPGSVQLIGGQYVPNTVPVYSLPAYGNGLNGQVNDYFNVISRQTGETNIVDATALKIREISLSYKIVSKFIEKIGAESLRVSVNARNPFTFFFADGQHGKKNLGYTDPEASNARNVGANSNAIGISEVGQYPTLRTLGFSLNLIF